MKELKITKPYDDQVMKFDSTAGRYYLTLEFVKSELDTKACIDDGELERRIKKNSRKIYNYIFYHSYTANKPVVNFCINHTENGRKFLKDVLLEQLESDLQSGYNDLSNQSPINFANGSVIDRSELLRNQVTVDTEQIIERNADYFGFNLFVMSQYSNKLIYQMVYNYTEREK